MIYYCCANDVNIGDHFSMLGVRSAVGLPGEDLFLEKRKEPLGDKLNTMSSGDSIVIGGGGIIKDYFKKYWLEILKYQKIRKYKVYLFGIGVCDHKYVSKPTVLERSLIQDIVNNSTISYMRLPIPIEDHRIKRTPCPSMLYVDEQYGKYASSGGSLLYASHSGLIGKEADENIKKLLKAYCNKHNMEYSQVGNIAKDDESVANIMKKYCEASLIVTTRLHGYIIGAALKKKIVAISKDYKIEGFASIINDRHPIDIMDINEDSLNRAAEEARALSDEGLASSLAEIRKKGDKIRRFING